MATMTETAPAAAIELRGIVKAFGGVQALAGATLKVDRASVSGLVGQNGAGKSTLIKIWPAFTRPTQAKSRLTGKPSTD
jgi:ABC-type sugar transport system ATPase subunit